MIVNDARFPNAQRICGRDTFGVGKSDVKPLLETIAASGGAKECAIMDGRFRNRDQDRAPPASP